MTVEERAISSIDGPVHFNVMNSDEFSSLRQPYHGETGEFANQNRVSQTVTVCSRPLMAAYEDYRGALSFKRPFLKIDAQGSDIDVAQSGGWAIKEFAGIQCELSFKRIYEGQPDYSSAIRFFQESGFRLSALIPNNTGHFPDLVEMDGVFIRNDENT